MQNDATLHAVDIVTVSTFDTWPSYPAQAGSSTPRLLGFIPDVSGILDRPPSRTMTAESGRTQLRLLTACTRVMLQSFRPRNQRAQGMPGARCTRGLVCKSAQRKRTRAYRFSRSSPAFPAQWLYGLCRALPGDE